QARSDSIPGLKIDTNNVQKAGHASTSIDFTLERCCSTSGPRPFKSNSSCSSSWPAASYLFPANSA
ncbi:MAG: hypothetical protein EBZ48_04580, partial [Proteobacteria bacterium]|nr:hypothetical protein [Pseudomonadota bacterium]